MPIWDRRLLRRRFAWCEVVDLGRPADMDPSEFALVTNDDDILTGGTRPKYDREITLYLMENQPARLKEIAEAVGASPGRVLDFMRRRDKFVQDENKMWNVYEGESKDGSDITQEMHDCSRGQRG